MLGRGNPTCKLDAKSWGVLGTLKEVGRGGGSRAGGKKGNGSGERQGWRGDRAGGPSSLYP